MIRKGFTMKKIFKSITAAILMMALIFSSVNINFVQAKESKKYVIKVNLGTNTTTIYKNGKAVKVMICSPSTETPTGTFYMPAKYRWHEMIGNCYAQYCSRISYEHQILFHSVWYYKNKDKSTMSVSAYNVMGQKASHGCVRLLCKDAKWIYDHCAVGTKIVIFKGKKKDDPLKRPSFTPIKNGKWTDWDPTDPDPKNPYKKARPKINAKNKNIEYGSKVNVKKLIKVMDATGTVLTGRNVKIKAKGKINTKKLGKYKVKYTVKAMTNKKKTTKTITFKVVDTKKPKFSGIKAKKNIIAGTTLNVLSGVKAKMKSGKNITSKIKVSVTYQGKKVKVSAGKVKFSKVGTYTIKYSVTTSGKKTATKTVKYTVIAPKIAPKVPPETTKVPQTTSVPEPATTEPAMPETTKSGVEETAKQ